MKAFVSDEIVFAPEVPAQVIVRLRSAGPGCLIPFKGPEPPSERSHDVRWPPWLWGVAATGLSVAEVFAGIAANHNAYIHPGDGGGPNSIALLLLLGAIVAWIAFAKATRSGRHRPEERRLAADMRDYHRRYVVPRTDLDLEARRVWSRVMNAVSRIARSTVIEQQLIDSVRVSAVLPYHLWDIAENLARLSALRDQHREILAGVQTDDPDVAVVLGPQRRAHALAVAKIERQVQQLEVFADRVAEADAAMQREEVVRQLAALNDSHVNLLARIDSPGEDNEIAELTHRDVQAVIDQANEAVRQANEAGRSLVLPDNGGD